MNRHLCMFLFLLSGCTTGYAGEFLVFAGPDAGLGVGTFSAPVKLGDGVVAKDIGGQVIVSCEPASQEIARLRTQLRLRAGELLVVRGQLAAEKRRNAK